MEPENSMTMDELRQWVRDFAAKHSCHMQVDSPTHVYLTDGIHYAEVKAYGPLPQSEVLKSAMQLIEAEGADMDADKGAPATSMFVPGSGVVKKKDLAIWKEAHQLAAAYLRKGAEL